MAQFSTIEILLEIEPIVKLVCEVVNCEFNLMNAANDENRKMKACNLKQITIGKGERCQNFIPIKLDDED